MSDPLQQLINRIPPPSDPDKVEGTVLNGAYGPTIALPNDYLMFLNTYGPGFFVEEDYDSLWVFDLLADARDTVGGGDVIELHLSTARELHETDPKTFPPVYPVVPGLLPWGSCDISTFHWWVDGHPDTWQVVVDTRYETIPSHYTFLEFLVVSITDAPGRKFIDYGSERFTGFRPSSKAS